MWWLDGPLFLGDTSKIYKAVSEMKNKENTTSKVMKCELCGESRYLHAAADCEHPKNGYCALYRLQAAQDIKDLHEELKEKANGTTDTVK